MNKHVLQLSYLRVKNCSDFLPKECNLNCKQLDGQGHALDTIVSLNNSQARKS